MLELMFCSLLTILPDYLYRRYVQGKRLGKEINFYSVWYELRWGITGCVILTVLLITVIFYNHPSTSNVTLFFRTVPILPETNGRVAEIFVGNSGPINKGAPIFRLDSSKQEAAVETARRKIAEIDAQMALARVDVAKAEGQLKEAQSNHQQTLDELEAKQELYRRNPGNVPFREIERLQERAKGQLGSIDAANASKQSIEERIATLLPAEKDSAEATLNQAQVDLDKTVIRAGVNGRVEQFVLRVGDIVNPLMRPAGVLIPEGAGQRSLQAGLRPDRGADHEGRNDRRGHLRFKAIHRHSDGCHQRPGLHRRGPVPGRRTVGRGPTGDATGHAPGLSRAPLQGRP